MRIDAPGRLGAIFLVRTTPDKYYYIQKLDVTYQVNLIDE